MTLRFSFSSSKYWRFCSSIKKSIKIREKIFIFLPKKRKQFESLTNIYKQKINKFEHIEFVYKPYVYILYILKFVKNKT